MTSGELRNALDDVLVELKRALEPLDVPDIEILGSETKPDGTVVLKVGIRPEVALSLVRRGLMCTECRSLKTEPVPHTDVEAMNQGYHPSTTRKCRDCGAYLEVRSK